MAKNNQNETNTLLVNVFEASKKIGSATMECVALLKSGRVTLKDETKFKLVGRAFKLGRICQIMNIDKVNAELVQDKIKHKLGTNTDDRRSLDEQRAYDAAKAAWSHVCKLAGLVNVKTGAARVTKANQTKPEAAAKVDVTQAVNDLPNVRKVQIEADVQAFALRIAEVMLKFSNRNASMVGETPWFGLFAEFSERAKALASAKPIEPAK